MKEQLLTAWQIHNNKNLLLLNALDNESLIQTLSKKGGRTVAAQFAHLHQTRLIWLEHVGKSFYDPQQALSKDIPLDQVLLINALNHSSQSILQLIESSWEKDGKLPSFKQGLIPFISYLIAHEAHHRGHIILTLKQCNIKLPSKLLFDLWEWK